MLSYQHAFHAGNHADVLKHLALISVLYKYNKKDKPYFYLDTHAGDGEYSLQSESAQKTQEHQVGASIFMQSHNDGCGAAIQHYQHLLSDYLARGKYPGSPLIAQSLLRSQDSAHFAELHPKAFAHLQANSKRGMHVYASDGLAVLKRFMPPKPNRGAVLIDPPYESASEYDEVIFALRAAIKKWAIACMMVWYPLLSDTRINRESGQVETNPKAQKVRGFIQQLHALPVTAMLDVQFCQQAPNEQVGMYGSGICIINPPWQVYEDLQEVLAHLNANLRTDNNALSSLKWIVQAA